MLKLNSDYSSAKHTFFFSQPAVLLRVQCGSLHAIMDTTRVGSCKFGKCISYNGARLTPEDFVNASRLRAADWLKMVRCNQRPIRDFVGEYFHPHSDTCRCRICSDGILVRCFVVFESIMFV